MSSAGVAAEEVAPASAESDGCVLCRLEVPSGWERVVDPPDVLPATDELIPGLDFAARAEMWRGPGAALVLTKLTGAQASTEPEAVARALLDHVRATPSYAGLAPGDTESLGWQERVQEGAAEAALAWRHVRNRTETRTRALAYLEASGHVSLIRADCVVSDEEGQGQPAGTAEAICAPVLAGVTLDELARERAPLASLPASTASDPAAGSAAGERAPGSSGSAGADPDEAAARTHPGFDPPPPPSLRAPEPGNEGVLVAQPPKPAKRGTPRWMYLVGGALVIIGLLWALRGRPAGRADGEDEEDERGGPSASDQGEGDESRAAERDGDEDERGEPSASDEDEGDERRAAERDSDEGERDEPSASDEDEGDESRAAERGEDDRDKEPV